MTKHSINQSIISTLLISVTFFYRILEMKFTMNE